MAALGEGAAVTGSGDGGGVEDDVAGGLDVPFHPANKVVEGGSQLLRSEVAVADTADGRCTTRSPRPLAATRCA